MRAVYVTEQGTVTEHGCGIIRIQSEKSIKYEIHKYVINVPSYNLFEHSKTLYYNFPNFLLEIKNKNLLFFSLFFFPRTTRLHLPDVLQTFRGGQ